MDRTYRELREKEKTQEVDGRITMKQQLLTQMARELSVSASYLSQVENDEKRPSEKVLSKIKASY